MRAISVPADRMKNNLKVNLYLNKRSVTSDESGEKLQATCRFRNNGSSAGSPRVLEPVWFDLRQKTNEKSKNILGGLAVMTSTLLAACGASSSKTAANQKLNWMEEAELSTIDVSKIMDDEPGQPSHGGPLHPGQQCQGEKRPGKQGNRF
jgi:hypothetical protein